MVAGCRNSAVCRDGCGEAGTSGKSVVCADEGSACRLSARRASSVRMLASTSSGNQWSSMTCQNGSRSGGYGGSSSNIPTVVSEGCTMDGAACRVCCLTVWPDNSVFCSRPMPPRSVARFSCAISSFPCCRNTVCPDSSVFRTCPMPLCACLGLTVSVCCSLY